MKNKVIIILIAVLQTSAVFSQVGTKSDKAIAKVEATLQYKYIEYSGDKVKCKRTTDKQRNKVTKNEKVIQTIGLIERELERLFQITTDSKFIETSPSKEILSQLDLINKLEPGITTADYLNEYNLYCKKYDVQKESKEFLQYMVSESIEALDYKDCIPYLDKLYLKFPSNDRLMFYQNKIISDVTTDLKTSKKIESFYNIDIQTEYGLYKQYQVAKVICAQIEFNIGNYFLEKGEKLFENGVERYNHGYGSFKIETFNEALEQIANAYILGVDSIKIIPTLIKINAFCNNKRNYKSFNLTNLSRISTSYQVKNSKNISSLKRIIKELDKTTITNESLLNLYDSLNSMQEFEYVHHRLQTYGYRQSNKERSLLMLSLGQTNTGCELLYETDIEYFLGVGHVRKLCETWYEKKKALEKKESILEEENKAKDWCKNNPDKFKLRSLLGKYSVTVEAYLGKPIEHNYQITAGSGIYSQQYKGNKYKNKDGIYEVGFSNGKVIMIHFYPENSIKYEPEDFSKENSIFDLDGGMNGVCTGNRNADFVGNIQMYSIDFDCSLSGIASTVFYGMDGKLMSVLVY